jgi:3-phenylpropionate/trans-cinnamate dioxygenase ferredoxin reductase subunit
MTKDVVIVGGGHAGGRVAERLRHGGFKEPIHVVGRETEFPYERPPLSKACLTGPEPVANAYLIPPSRWQEIGVTFHLGREVTGIDRAGRRIMSSDGKSLPYRHLVLATGLTPRSLPALTDVARHVSYLRSFEDALRLRTRLRPGTRLLIAGAGLIGLEVAASAVGRGVEVTIVEAAERPLMRLLPERLAQWLSVAHRAAGVRILCGRKITHAETASDEAAVVLDDGRQLRADEILVAIGAAPNDALARAAGLNVDDGILVNARGETSDPDISAVGDVARHNNVSFGARQRLESWRNAEDLAAIVAANLCGDRQSYGEVPWFWTDQYDWNIQIAGTLSPGLEVLERGAIGERGYLAYYLESGVLRGAVGVGCGRDVRMAREIMRSGAVVDQADLLAKGFRAGAELVEV